ncbi:2-oxoglutarate carboxylase small subunit, partial [Frankliniella fusca]
MIHSLYFALDYEVHLVFCNKLADFNEEIVEVEYSEVLEVFRMVGAEVHGGEVEGVMVVVGLHGKAIVIVEVKCMEGMDSIKLANGNIRTGWSGQVMIIRTGNKMMKFMMFQAVLLLNLAVTMMNWRMLKSVHKLEIFLCLEIVGGSMCKAVDSSVKGKFNLCRGGLEINDLKRCLCQRKGMNFKDASVLLFIGMNDLLKVSEEDIDGALYSLISKLLNMEVEKLYLCSLPTLPGKINSAIEQFNKKLYDLSCISDSIVVLWVLWGADIS